LMPVMRLIEDGKLIMGSIEALATERIRADDVGYQMTSTSPDFS